MDKRAFRGRTRGFEEFRKSDNRYRFSDRADPDRFVGGPPGFVLEPGIYGTIGWIGIDERYTEIGFREGSRVSTELLTAYGLPPRLCDYLVGEMGQSAVIGILVGDGEELFELVKYSALPPREEIDVCEPVQFAKEMAVIKKFFKVDTDEDLAKDEYGGLIPRQQAPDPTPQEAEIIGRHYNWVNVPATTLINPKQVPVPAEANVLERYFRVSVGMSLIPIKGAGSPPPEVQALVRKYYHSSTVPVFLPREQQLTPMTTNEAFHLFLKETKMPDDDETVSELRELAWVELRERKLVPWGLGSDYVMPFSSYSAKLRDVRNKTCRVEVEMPNSAPALLSYPRQEFKYFPELKPGIPLLIVHYYYENPALLRVTDKGKRAEMIKGFRKFEMPWPIEEHWSPTLKRRLSSRGSSAKKIRTDTRGTRSIDKE